MDIKGLTSTAADLMTIFGVGGFFTWSFVRRPIQEQSLADIGISIFAYSIKTFFSLVALLLLSIPAYSLHFFIVLATAGTYGSEDGVWNTSQPLAYSVAYAVTTLVFIPLSVLALSSIFTWSLAPFRRLGLRLTGRG